MSGEGNKVERRYALIRVETGVYLLPSNDGKTLWRINSYMEDGSGAFDLGGGKWKYITGKHWATARRPMPSSMSELYADDFLWGEEWEYFSMVHPTRAEAIEEALGAR